MFKYAINVLDAVDTLLASSRSHLRITKNIIKFWTLFRRWNCFAFNAFFSLFLFFANWTVLVVFYSKALFFLQSLLMYYIIFVIHYSFRHLMKPCGNSIDLFAAVSLSTFVLFINLTSQNTVYVMLFALICKYVIIIVF